MDLTVEVKGDGAVLLLGFRPAGDAEPGKIQVPPSGAGAAALDVRGHFIWYPATAPRIVLLNHMWRLSPGVAWLSALVCAGIGLALAGCLVFPTRPLTSRTGAPAATAALRAGGGSALFAASLTLLYAVLTPPLCGPDEPYHLLGFADLTQDPALAKDTLAWMGETHLWRIRFEPTERFRTIDVGRPYVAQDASLRPTEVAMRSATLARLWRGVASTLTAAPAPRVLLALRLLNALVFAIAVGGATAFAVAVVDAPYPQWLAFAFLFVPSLPFFAMHVSETALLCSVYVLLATSVAVLFLDGPSAHWAGVPLGLATGLMLAGGRSPWPLVGLVGLVLLGRVLLGASEATNARGAALKFWGGIAAGVACFFVTIDDAYRVMVDAHIRLFTRSVPSVLRGVGAWLIGHPAAVVALVVGGAVLEVVFRGPRARIAARRELAARLVRWAAFAGVVAVALSLVGSLCFSYPQLPLEPARPLTAPERIAAILATMATMFRLAQPNFLLTSSFWVGFGWLDTMPGPALQALLVALVALALVLLLLRVARDRATRRFAWLLILGAGGVVSLVLYSLVTQGAPQTLGGRYLIGWYLPVLAVVGAGLALDGPSDPARVAAATHSGAERAAILLGVAGSIHLYCLCFMLARYF
jgi:hypothetical protein